MATSAARSWVLFASLAVALACGGNRSDEQVLAAEVSTLAEQDRAPSLAPSVNVTEAEGLLRGIAQMYPFAIAVNDARATFEKCFADCPCYRPCDKIDDPVRQSECVDRCDAKQCAETADAARRQRCVSTYVAKAGEVLRAFEAAGSKAETDCARQLEAGVRSALVSTASQLVVDEVVKTFPLLTVHSAMEPCAKILLCNFGDEDVPCEPKHIAAFVLGHDFRGQAWPSLVLKTADGRIVSTPSLKVAPL